MSDLQTFTLKDLEAGKVEVKSSRGGGRFQAIRDIAVGALKNKGEACTYYELAKVVEKELGLPTPQQAYNYCKSALRTDKRFEIRTVVDRKIVVRVA